jgi:myosin heavy subunit
MNWINTRTIFISIAAAVIAGLGVYFVQQREIDRLRAENQKLMAQHQSVSKELETALASAAACRDELERLQKDKGELLRLRGEVGLLRKQTKEAEKLRESNRQLSASVAQASQDSQQREAEAEAEQQKQLAIVKLNDSRQLVLAMLMYAADNQDQIPADITLASNYLSKGESPLTKSNQFDLVIQGSLKNVANPSTTIAVREREASLYKGERAKVYGFADGHSELKREPPEGFEAWEKAHTIPLQQ